MFACCHQATFPPAPIKSKRLFMVILIKTVSSSKVDLRKEREKKQRFRWRNIPQSDRQKRGHFPTPFPFLLFFLFSPLPFFPPQPGDLQPPISPAVKVVPAPPSPPPSWYFLTQDSFLPPFLPASSSSSCPQAHGGFGRMGPGRKEGGMDTVLIARSPRFLKGAARGGVRRKDWEERSSHGKSTTYAGGTGSGFFFGAQSIDICFSVHIFLLPHSEFFLH